MLRSCICRLHIIYFWVDPDFFTACNEIQIPLNYKRLYNSVRIPNLVQLKRQKLKYYFFLLTMNFHTYPEREKHPLADTCPVSSALHLLQGHPYLEHKIVVRTANRRFLLMKSVIHKTVYRLLKTI